MCRLFIAGICFALTLSLVSCSKKKPNTTESISKSASQTAPGKSPSSVSPIQKISDNPGFFTAAAINPKSNVAKDLDNLLRPFLAKLFEEVKLVEESQIPETKIDGEVVENRLVYVVRLLLTPEEGDDLHSALRAGRFVSSPRLGRKPTHSQSTVAMSLMKSTSLRGYSLVIKVDAGKQQIVIESYKLGSKYDRM